MKQFTDDQIAEYRAEYAAKRAERAKMTEYIKEIAKRHRCSETAVYNMIMGRGKYAHLGG